MMSPEKESRFIYLSLSYVLVKVSTGHFDEDFLL